MHFLKNQNQKNKINLMLKQNQIIIVSSLIFKKEKNRLTLEQKIKRLNSFLTKVPNKILGKVLNQTIFKNLLNICNGSLCFISSIHNLISKQKLNLFYIICIKFFNKIYFINQFSFIKSLSYSNSLQCCLKIIEKSVKFFYFKLSK